MLHKFNQKASTMAAQTIRLTNIAQSQKQLTRVLRRQSAVTEALRAQIKLLRAAMLVNGTSNAGLTAGGSSLAHALLCVGLKVTASPELKEMTGFGDIFLESAQSYIKKTASQRANLNVSMTESSGLLTSTN